METLNIKVMQVNMTVAKTNAVLEAGKPEPIERQLATLKAITAEIDRMRLHVEAKKLAAEEEIADIQTWNAHLDAKVEEADNEVVKYVSGWMIGKGKQKCSLKKRNCNSKKNFIKPSWNCKWSSKLRRLANTRFTLTRQATSKPSLTAPSWTGHDFGESLARPSTKQASRR